MRAGGRWGFILAGAGAALALAASTLVAARCVRLERELAATERRALVAEERAVRLPVPAAGEPTLERYWYEEAQAARAAQHVLLDPVEARLLRRQGLANPVADLRASLRGGPVLRPASTGGPPGGWLFDPARIAPLNDRWVFARFDDGESEGSCLLEYHVDAGGRVRWKLLHAVRG